MIQLHLKKKAYKENPTIALTLPIRQPMPTKEMSDNGK
ncbi:MAG: hypothetical protein ACJAYE_003491 [Candidatus Azotimanducaceae bacterium]|jgi:hypothetical protein